MGAKNALKMPHFCLVNLCISGNIRVSFASFPREII